MKKWVYGNEQGGDFGNEQGADDAGGAAADGRACEGDEDDGDNLEDMIQRGARNITAEERSRKSREGENNVKEDCVWC
jgi:hypothetical protein